MSCKIRNKGMLVVLFLIFMISLAFAATDITVQKTAPSKIKREDILSVTIIVKNDRNTSIGADVQETVGGADPVDPPVLVSPEGRTDMIAVQPPYYEWKLSIDANSFKTITYKIKPKNPGFFSIGPTKVYVDGNLVTSNSLQVEVICNQNNICEPNFGENYNTCPEDCRSGSGDGICDLVRDGRCDPDCTSKGDLDCACGNNICEKFENKIICPADCKKSLWQYPVLGLVIIIGCFLAVYGYKRFKKKNKEN